MFEVEIPCQRVPSDTLDRRLARGWFRSGPVLFRGEMLYIDQAVRGLVHIRLPLAWESRSRGRRRVLSRNRQRFRCEWGPAVVDAERERLYELMKPRFFGAVSRQLAPLVYGLLPEVFDTRELCVYDGERLVAVSYFDVGGDSIVGQLALHDPAYASYSLGYYTMLEEIEFGRRCHARYYYPGYIIPGLPAFEYKLRIGDVQYLDGGLRWRRRARPPHRVPRVDRLMRRVQALEQALDRAGLDHERWSYPGFWIGYFDGADRPGSSYLRALLHARCSAPDESGCFLVVEYLDEGGEYQLSRVRPDAHLDIAEEYEPADALPERCEWRALAYEEVLCADPAAERVVAALSGLLAEAGAGGAAGSGPSADMARKPVARRSLRAPLK